MEVRVELTKEDLLAYNLFYLGRSPEARRQLRTTRVGWVASGIVFAAAIVLVLNAAGLVRGFWPVLTVFTLIEMVLLLQLFARARRALRQNVKRLTDEGQDAATLAPRTYTLSDETIAYESNLSGAWTRWEAIEGIQETAEHIFICLGLRVAHIIPKRAFATPADAQQFADAARLFKAACDSGRASPSHRNAGKIEPGATAGSVEAPEPTPGSEEVDPIQDPWP